MASAASSPRARTTRARRPHADLRRHDEITATDSTRYYAFRGGISPEELATRENVKLDTILKSLQKFEAHRARFSAESAETAVRCVFISKLPQVERVMDEGLAAMKTIQIGSRTDPETGETTFDYETIPDHDSRFRSIDAMKKLLEAVTPKSPLVSVDARSQHVHGLMPGQPGGGLGTGARPTSMESLLREVRAERGLMLTAPGDDKPKVYDGPSAAETDFELAGVLEEIGTDADEAAPIVETPGEYVEED